MYTYVAMLHKCIHTYLCYTKTDACYLCTYITKNTVCGLQPKLCSYTTSIKLRFNFVQVYSSFKSLKFAR